MGTPEFALAPLQALHNAGHDIVGVVCQPDKINTRGNKIKYSPIKTFALSNAIPVYQFEKIREFGVDQLAKLQADVVITCAYGQIIGQDLLDMCKYGVLNIHASLLPKYRGASPVESALLNADSITGVSIVQTQIGLDDGDVLYSRSLPIEAQDNSISLFKKVSDLGAQCIVEVLRDLPHYVQKRESQNPDGVTLCKKIKKQNALIDFSEQAQTIVNKIKAYSLSPTAYFVYNDERYNVYNAQVNALLKGKCGEILRCKSKQGLTIACSDFAVDITQIQSQNGKILDIKAFLNGKSFNVGDLII